MRDFYSKVVRIHLVSLFMDKIVPVQTIKACGSEESHIHSFLTSTICGGEWPASRPGHFTPGESLLLADQECGRASQAARTI